MSENKQVITSNNLYEILQSNEQFLKNQDYRSYRAGKYPDRRMVILTCMDTRLVELLEKSMGITQGQAKIIRVAGAQVHHPFGSAMHSILIAIHMLGANEVFVVGHHDCGMQSVEKETFVENLTKNGIAPETIQMMEHAGIDLEKWLFKFDNVYESVKHTVSIIENHPFLSGAGIPVHGLVIDPHTGKLELVVDGNKHSAH